MRPIPAYSPIRWMNPRRRAEPGSLLQTVSRVFLAIMATAIILAVLSGRFG